MKHLNYVFLLLVETAIISHYQVVLITQMDMTIINAMSMRNTVVSNGFKTIQTIILVENSKPLARILAAVSHLHTAVKSYAKVRNNRYFFLTPLFYDSEWNSIFPISSYE